jgi:hypothetical protein
MNNEAAQQAQRAAQLAKIEQDRKRERQGYAQSAITHYWQLQAQKAQSLRNAAAYRAIAEMEENGDRKQLAADAASSAEIKAGIQGKLAQQAWTDYQEQVAQYRQRFGQSCPVLPIPPWWFP